MFIQKWSYKLFSIVVRRCDNIVLLVTHKSYQLTYNTLLQKFRFIAISDYQLVMNAKFGMELVPGHCFGEGIVIALHLVESVCFSRNNSLSFFDTGVLAAA